MYFSTHLLPPIMAVHLGGCKYQDIMTCEWPFPPAQYWEALPTRRASERTDSSTPHWGTGSSCPKRWRRTMVDKRIRWSCLTWAPGTSSGVATTVFLPTTSTGSGPVCQTWLSWVSSPAHPAASNISPVKTSTVYFHVFPFSRIYERTGNHRCGITQGTDCEKCLKDNHKKV